jgi:penicillin-binding protein 1B
VGVPNVIKTWRAWASRRVAGVPVDAAGRWRHDADGSGDHVPDLANGGFNTPMRGIRSVLTAEGEPLKRYPFQIQQRFDPAPST